MPSDPNIRIQITTDTRTAAETLAALRLWLLEQEVNHTTNAAWFDEEECSMAAQIAQAKHDVVQAVFDQIGR